MSEVAKTILYFIVGFVAVATPIYLMIFHWPIVFTIVIAAILIAFGKILIEEFYEWRRLNAYKKSKGWNK